MSLAFLKKIVFLMTIFDYGNAMQQPIDQVQAEKQKIVFDEGKKASGQLFELVTAFIKDNKGSKEDEKNLKALNEKIRALLAEGADINVKNDDGKTLIFLASCFRCYSALVMLDQCGADICLQDHAGWTPLHYAAVWGDEWLVNVLLGARSYIKNQLKALTLKTNEGKTLLEIARQRLLEVKAEFDRSKNLVNRKRKVHALVHAQEDVVKGYKNIVDLLKNAKDRIGG